MLQPIKHISLDAEIWRVFENQQDNKIFIQLKSRLNKFVYALLDPQSPELLWEGLELEDDKWKHIAHVGQNRVVFQHYPDPSLPDASGFLLLKLEAEEPELIGFDDFLSFKRILKDGHYLLSYGKHESEKLFLWDERDQNPQEIQDKSDLDGLTEENGKIKAPDLYTDSSAYFEDLRLFIENKTGLKASGKIDYLELPKAIALSFYIYNNGIFKKFFLMCSSREGAIWVYEQTADQLKGMGDDSFFEYDGKVFVIREKDQLVVYEI